MSTLTTEEQEMATAIKESDLGELSGNTLEKHKMGFKDNVISEQGAETQAVLTEIDGVAYKVMCNSASKLSKAKAKMNDVASRHGRDSKAYDSAQSDYDEALVDNQDDVLRYETTKTTKEDVGQAVMKGLTF